MKHTITLVAIHIQASGSDPARDVPATVAAARFVDGVRDLTLCADRPSAADLQGLLQDHLVIGHDLRRQRGLLRLHGLTVPDGVDTRELARVLLPPSTALSLADLLGQLVSGPLPEPLDTAMGRVCAVHALWRALLRLAAELPAATLEALAGLAHRSGWSMAPAFALARRCADGRAPHDAPRDGPQQQRSPLRPSAVPAAVDIPALDGLLAPGGALAAGMRMFEDRPAQRRMLRLVADALNRGDQLLVEAGTGTGKSLAYLLPAAAWAAANGRPVVVATHTLSLQDQLWEQDLPLVRSLLGSDPSFCLLKGRSNYLCRTRLEAQLARADADPEGAATLARVLVWAGRTHTGDRAELGLDQDEERAWRSVAADVEGCTAERCPHGATGDCWVGRARRRAEASHLVVVSHALLASDMVLDHRLLPGRGALIVDEAHHLEDVATAALGFEVSERQLRDSVSQLSAESGRGVLDRLAALTARPMFEGGGVEAVPEAAAALRAAAREVQMTGDTLFDALAHFLARHAGGAGGDTRITAGVRSQPEWLLVETAWQPFDAAARGLRRGCAGLLQALVLAEDRLDDGAVLVADLQAALRELAGLAGALEHALVQATHDDIVWAHRERGRALTLSLAPLDVAEVLAERLFAGEEAVVLTSATLRADGGFDFLRRRLGLPDAPGEAIDSPFDYERSVLLQLPTDMPAPDQDGYQEALDRTVAGLAAELGGRTLVLYTSHVGLRATYHSVRHPLGLLGIAVRGQGLDGDRHRLVSGFRAGSEKTLLLGTRSFWEGIDVPGPALSCLVVARLPFDVPADPVFSARAETFEDPFRQYALPRAVLRFRQGFGRLIRGGADRGVFVVLDSRAVQRGYGPAFLDALPPCRRQVAPLAELPRLARCFLDAEPDGPADPGSPCAGNSDMENGGGSG